jgi:2-keto-4-pentenoate hydratase/2-oxohepta-3-ene-1,7-dioic acid hydratase in catechol pathway
VSALTPSKIVCIGRNYLEHAKELGNDVPPEPLIFLKPPSAIIRGGDTIELPPQSQQVEHEGEIGVVIGRKLRNASDDEARSAIGGIVAINDVTARDLQRKDGQWTRAKGFDTFCPVGVPSADIGDLDALEVVCRVNGEVRQRGHSKEMAYGIITILTYISRVMTLLPGDLVATGTPAGIGPLRDGDEVEVEVVGKSVVRNPVRVPKR